jgi:hypothetical protein
MQEEYFLGRLSDQEVARRLGYTVKAVTRQREWMGIRAYVKMLVNYTGAPPWRLSCVSGGSIGSASANAAANTSAN